MSTDTTTLAAAEERRVKLDMIAPLSMTLEAYRELLRQFEDTEMSEVVDDDAPPTPKMREVKAALRHLRASRVAFSRYLELLPKQADPLADAPAASAP